MYMDNGPFQTREEAEHELRRLGYTLKASPDDADWPWNFGLCDARIQRTNSGFYWCEERA